MITTNKFEEFREKYLAYVGQYNGYKILQKVTINNEPVDTSDIIRLLGKLQMAVGDASTALLYQMHDHFTNRSEKAAYINSIKGFCLTEIDNWEIREPILYTYAWTSRITREWMPWCLYDILDEAIAIIGDNVPIQSLDPFESVLLGYKKRVMDGAAKIMGKNQKFSSEIECAAFCEILYDLGYLGKKNNDRPTKCAAVGSYWFPEIKKIALQSVRRKDREEKKCHLLAKLKWVKE